MVQYSVELYSLSGEDIPKNDWISTAFVQFNTGFGSWLKNPYILIIYNLTIHKHRSVVLAMGVGN